MKRVNNCLSDKAKEYTSEITNIHYLVFTLVIACRHVREVHLVLDLFQALTLSLNGTSFTQSIANKALNSKMHFSKEAKNIAYSMSRTDVLRRFNYFSVYPV
jgi:hypothetical protein